MYQMRAAGSSTWQMKYMIMPLVALAYQPYAVVDPVTLLIIYCKAG